MTASVIRTGCMLYGHLGVRALGLGHDESWLAPNAELPHGPSRMACSVVVVLPDD